MFVSEKERNIFDGDERHGILSLFGFVIDYLLLNVPLMDGLVDFCSV